ncbi:hypothetical protein DSO57_1016699, partial [Entomophthora muscae]
LAPILQWTLFTGSVGPLPVSATTPLTLVILTVFDAGHNLLGNSGSADPILGPQGQRRHGLTGRCSCQWDV